MHNRWDDDEVVDIVDDPVAMRVYTSRLLGEEPDLVLHGGGNTSVKVSETNLFGQTEELLYVKGSGWDLATIKKEGFSPVKLDVLKKMAELPELSDAEMVRYQRAAMTNPYAPNPSVEAILHADIPFRFVDHTHADAVVTLTNTPSGEKLINEVFGPKVLVIPYVMPGFVLAKKIHEMTRGLDWSQYDGMILMHHGIFTFGETAKGSYDRMIELVSKAEEAIESKTGSQLRTISDHQEDLVQLARMRKAIAEKRGAAVVVRSDTSNLACGFSSIPNLDQVANRGPLTPDHVIRTKSFPLIYNDQLDKDLTDYVEEYEAYFQRNATPELKQLDPAPRWAVWPRHGVFCFGKSIKEADIIRDIVQHTYRCIQWAEALEGYRSLPEKDLFEVEYWELEQAKLKKSAQDKEFQGKVVLVTGAASGIGKATAELFYARGAAVVALDLNPEVADLFDKPDLIGIECDLTYQPAIKRAVREVVRTFGGLDILISNAGTFPATHTIAEMDLNMWNQSLEINLSSHQYLLQACIPYLEEGIDPCVLIMGSKNVPAPGKKASAYSVAKAGLSQMARIAALELADKHIRVNVLHPHGVFDTAIWSEDTLKERAESYDMTVSEYKRNNLLKVEITSKDVAETVCALCGKAFSKTTGAQIPLDGGNDRVI